MDKSKTPKLKGNPAGKKRRHEVMKTQVRISEKKKFHEIASVIFGARLGKNHSGNGWKLLTEPP